MNGTAPTEPAGPLEPPTPPQGPTHHHEFIEKNGRAWCSLCGIDDGPWGGAP